MFGKHSRIAAKPVIDQDFVQESDQSIALRAAPEHPYVFTSSVCRSDHFHMPLYQYWCRKMSEVPRFHRKQWEFVYLAHALFERGFLAPSKRGVGFGVGNEPLVDLFSSFGCEVVATDLSPEEAEGTGWIESNQHSSSKNALYKGIAPKGEFEKLVDFRHVNMNDIPTDLRNFDFCYSSCSIEHVGSLDKSFDFLMNSIAVLNPGGISIHTTELNLTSDDETIDTGSTVLWRRQDFARLSRRLEQEGHSIEPLDFFIGNGEINHHVDVPPFKSSPHLRLKLASFASTSIGVIIRKGRC